MANDNKGNSRPLTSSQPVRLIKGDGSGGAPGPKYTIPCPKPKK